MCVTKSWFESLEIENQRWENINGNYLSFEIRINEAKAVFLFQRQSSNFQYFCWYVYASPFLMPVTHFDLKTTTMTPNHYIYIYIFSQNDRTIDRDAAYRRKTAEENWCRQGSQAGRQTEKKHNGMLRGKKKAAAAIHHRSYRFFFYINSLLYLFWNSILSRLNAKRCNVMKRKVESGKKSRRRRRKWRKSETKRNVT